MTKSMTVLLLFSIVLNGFGQDNGGLDWFGSQKIVGSDSTTSPVLFIFNAGNDTLLLNPLNGYDPRFMNHGLYNFGTVAKDENRIDSSIISGNTDEFSEQDYYQSCGAAEVQLVDSIDLNEDGIKELVLLREWHCSSGPKSSLMNEFGVGGQQQSSSCYEIWDVTTKQPLGTLIFSNLTTIIVSTNVMRSDGYLYEVEFNRKGTITLSNYSGYGNILTMGTYKYDSKLNTFIKIREE